jgi:hypothetical protein
VGRRGGHFGFGYGFGLELELVLAGLLAELGLAAVADRVVIALAAGFGPGRGLDARADAVDDCQVGFIAVELG